MDRECNCPDRQLVRRQVAGGAIHYGNQCLICGKWKSVAKSTLSPGEMATAGDFDESISEKYWAERRVQQQEEYRKKSADERQAFFKEYSQYLKSEKWQDKRLRVLERDGKKCQACLRREASQVHHLTYDHVFNEPLFDLVSICELCHDFLTQLDRERRGQYVGSN